MGVIATWYRQRANSPARQPCAEKQVASNHRGGLAEIESSECTPIRVPAARRLLVFGMTRQTFPMREPASLPHPALPGPVDSLFFTGRVVVERARTISRRCSWIDNINRDAG